MIFDGRPKANFLPEQAEKLNPVRCNRGSGPRLRKSRGKKRKATYLQALVADRDPCFQQLSLELLLRKQLGQELFRLRWRALSLSLRRPISSVYDRYFRKWRLSTADASGLMCEGPLDIYARHMLLLFLKIATARPKQIVWEKVVSSRGTTKDFLYEVWQFAKVIPFVYDRIRVRSAISLVISAFNLPSPRNFVLYVSCVRWYPFLKLWSRLVLKQWFMIFPYWSRLISDHTRRVILPPRS